MVFYEIHLLFFPVTFLQFVLTRRFFWWRISRLIGILKNSIIDLLIWKFNNIPQICQPPYLNESCCINFHFLWSFVCMFCVGKDSAQIRDVFCMYSNMKSGVTMKDLCIRFNPSRLNIDERSLVEFGILEGFIRRIHKVRLA